MAAFITKGDVMEFENYKKYIIDIIQKIDNTEIKNVVNVIYEAYKNDKMIWVIFQNARKLDRFLKSKLFKKKYDFYLPDKIKR